MWPQRIKRLLILSVIIGVIYLAAQVFARWPGKNTTSNQILGTFDQTGAQVVKAGGQVLGKAIDSMPIDPSLKSGVMNFFNQGSFNDSSSAAQIIEEQKQNMTDQVQELPQTGIKEIKKAIFKDFCNQIMN